LGHAEWRVRDKGPGKRSSEFMDIAENKATVFPPLVPMESSKEEAELKSQPYLGTYSQELQRSQELVSIVPWPLRAHHWWAASLCLIYTERLSITLG
jgi:hypothetical protein